MTTLHLHDLTFCHITSFWIHLNIQQTNCTLSLGHLIFEMTDVFVSSFSLLKNYFFSTESPLHHWTSCVTIVVWPCCADTSAVGRAGKIPAEGAVAQHSNAHLLHALLLANSEWQRQKSRDQAQLWVGFFWGEKKVLVSEFSDDLNSLRSSENSETLSDARSTKTTWAHFTSCGHFFVQTESDCIFFKLFIYFCYRK